MKTPNNTAGLVTEKIMAQVRKKLPDIKTHEYNRTYEAVYAVLEDEFMPAPDVVRFPGGGGLFINRKKP